MRIALAPEGTRGDIHPLLGLGSRLVEEGHAIVVCAPPDFEQATAEWGFEFRPIGTSVRDYLEARADVMAGRPLRALREGHRYFELSADAQFRALPAATRDADWIVGAGIQMAGASAAEHHGVPYRFVAYCPSLLPSREHVPIMLPFQRLPGWVNRGAWRIVLATYNRTLRKLLNRLRAGLGLAPVRNVYRHLLTPRPILAADEGLAALPPDCPFEVDRLPCLHPLNGPPLPEKLESFLEQGPAPVYLGFGSMPDPDPAATTREVLRALEILGCRGLVSRGWAGLGDGPLAEGVFAVGSVSHAELFPRVAAVVHHGGAGTTTTAARAGVPQIIVPHVMDQFYWAARVRRLGLGPPSIPRRRLTAERLAAALSETLDNETLSERARDLGRELRARASLESAPSVLLGYPGGDTNDHRG
jgi:vancomycin aglycone glucosyltransferase